MSRTIKDMIEDYMQAGDWLRPNMNEVLEQIKEGTGIQYSYKNLYSGIGGFMAHVKFWKRGHKGKVEAFIKGDDMGHFVEKLGER